MFPYIYMRNINIPVQGSQQQGVWAGMLVSMLRYSMLQGTVLRCTVLRVLLCRDFLLCKCHSNPYSTVAMCL